MSTGRPKPAIAWQRRTIEPGIAPLVDAMNANPTVRTLASCQGHFWTGRPPFVAFTAPVAFASMLERMLRDDNYFGPNRLSTLWVVYGGFDAAFNLNFRLHAPLHKLAGPCSSTFKRAALRSELAALTEIVQLLNGLWDERQRKEQRHGND